MKERVEDAGRQARPDHVGLDVPLRLRADPAQGDRQARLQVELLDLRRRGPEAADDAGAAATSTSTRSASSPARCCTGSPTTRTSCATPRRRGRRAATASRRPTPRRTPLYQRRLREANALDFDDLIMTTVHLFQAFPEVRETYRRRFRHVLVDEYQDTNHAQYALIHQLCAEPMEELPAERRRAEERVEPAELMVVGDADQSIYAFRGANIRNILDFEQDFPNATSILLEQNYRSTQTILTAANSVIGHNKGRKPKRLWSDAGDGDADRRVRRRRRARRGAVRLRGDRQAHRRRRQGRRRRGLLPHQRPVPGVRGGVHPHRPCPTRSSAACASTSAARCATRSPTCGCWSTPPTRSRCAGSSTPPSAASATAPSSASRRWPTASGSPSGRRCAAPRRRPGWPPGRLTNIQGFVAMVEELQSMVDAGERADVILESVLGPLRLPRGARGVRRPAGRDPGREPRRARRGRPRVLRRPGGRAVGRPGRRRRRHCRARPRRLPRAGGAGRRHRPDPRRARRRRGRRAWSP